MLFSLLSTRFITRNACISSAQAFRRVQPSMITRHFAVSRISWAPTTATSQKQSGAKKSSASKTAKKPAKKQTATKKKAKKAKKATPKPRVAKKVVKVKKPAPRIKITAESKGPKRPITSYFRFLKKYIVGLDRREGESGLQFGIRGTKEAAASWASLTEAEKKPFSDEHKAELVEYRKKKEEYFNTVNPAVIKEINRQRKAKGKQLIHVKKSHFVAPPYFIFLAEERAKTPNLVTLADNQAFVAETGRKWSTMSDEEKQSYRTLYDERKAMSASK